MMLLALARNCTTIPPGDHAPAECAGLCFQHGGAAILARLGGFGDNFCTLAGGIALHMSFGKKTTL
jgi:hypothetical protein